LADIKHITVKQALEQIPHMKSLPYRNGEYKAWIERVITSLRAEYGVESSEARRFMNAPGKAFVVGTETGREQEYQRQLDCYEEVLKSLLEG